MNGRWRMRWGSPGALLRDVVVSNVVDLESVIDRIAGESTVENASFQIDIITIDDPQSDPILIQVVLAGAFHGSVLWYGDGVTYAAVERGIAPPATPLIISKFHGLEELDPEYCLITSRLAREVVVLLAMTGSQRAEAVNWVEMAMD